MSKTEAVLLATTILFASTTAGLALRLSHGPLPYATMHHASPPSKANWENRRKEMFTKQDKDASGTLTREEMRAGMEERIEKMFSKLDTDASGTITPEELEQGRKNLHQKMMEQRESRRQQSLSIVNG
ncbi:MAG: hypothetical protein COY40_00475 [Alphaproteobacteria bacterium CG_4_10_14_0_8_um_filter_53_9]|nr:MAG: hypothetical protein COY40_00475 [Alphaproteobacteria bacterium CG_4_10_14_0_8_um_filter_53_9]